MDLLEGVAVSVTEPDAAGRDLQLLLLLLLLSPHQDEGVVYLIARKKYRHPQAWVLAVDTRNKTLVGAAEFGTERQPYGSFMYFASDIAKYIKPDTTGIISEHLFLNEKCYLVASIDPFLGIK